MCPYDCVVCVWVRLCLGVFVLVYLRVTVIVSRVSMFLGKVAYDLITLAQAEAQPWTCGREEGARLYSVCGLDIRCSS